jgi:hypothetical protein
VTLLVEVKSARSYSGLSRLEGIEPGRRGGGRVSLIAVPGR